MNIRILYLVGMYVLITASILDATDTDAKSYADKYYIAFNKWQGDGAGYMFANFNKEVPVSLQADVLDQMLDRACANKPTKDYLAANYVFKYIAGVHPEFTFSQQFDANLYTLAKDSNHLARRDVIDFLGRMKREKDHDLIVAALNDPDDEVREAAIEGLRDRPDTEAVYQKFIHDHQSDPAYAPAIRNAQAVLDASHEAKTNGEK